MTKEQILSAVSMRLDGKSLEYIGEKLGCTRQNISLVFRSLNRGGGKKGAPLNIEAWERPEIAKWMTARKMTIPALAKEIGVKPCTLRQWFRIGKNVPYYRFGALEDISKITGISVDDLLKRRKEA